MPCGISIRDKWKHGQGLHKMVSLCKTKLFHFLKIMKFFLLATLFAIAYQKFIGMKSASITAGIVTIGILSRGVFEPCTSPGSGLFFYFWAVVLPKFLDKSSI